MNAAFGGFVKKFQLSLATNFGSLHYKSCFCRKTPGKYVEYIYIFISPNHGSSSMKYSKHNMKQPTQISSWGVTIEAEVEICMFLGSAVQISAACWFCDTRKKLSLEVTGQSCKT